MTEEIIKCVKGESCIHCGSTYCRFVDEVNELMQEYDELKFENDRYKQLLKGCPTEDEDCGLCVIDEQNKRLKQENRWQRDEEKYLKECCIKAGKELEKNSFAWDGKEKNLVVQALELNKRYEILKQENKDLKDTADTMLMANDIKKQDIDSLREANDRLEQENKELKIYVESNKQQVEEAEMLVMDNDRLQQEVENLKDTIYYNVEKYRSALEEIREMTKKYDAEVGDTIIANPIQDCYDIYCKINEVLNKG